MFIDRAKILVKAGTGGNGMSSFRREKYVPKGGPSGGDGGHGASVILRADKNINTLVDFRYRRLFNAPNGANGQSGNKFGKNAEDLIIPVPVGTLVKREDTDQVIADLDVDGKEAIVAKGGRGGRGNARFSTSANRAPTFAEKGEPGEEVWLKLELKVLADVGLLGYPSVGKSSILRRVSAAQPDVAAYHFTTLTPVLGVVDLEEERSFVMADIPGLIEGASEGVGLGHDFLRHIERTKILIHVLDVSGLEGRDPIEDFEKINEELKKYNEKLSRKLQIVGANKIDLYGEEHEIYLRLKEYMQEKGIEVYPISALTGQGMKELMERAWTLVQEYVEEPEELDTSVTYKAEPEVDFVITRADDAAFVIQGKRIEKLVAMTNFTDEESLRRFQKIWRYMELDQELQKKGIKEGDLVRILDMEFEYRQ